MMSPRNPKKNLTAAALLLCVTLAMFPSGGFSEEEDPGLCELALAVCWATSFSPNDPAPFLNCIWGYSFCKEYVEPHLGR